ncbi:permease [Halosimplex aquaticum]|nr:permease [Halosimplex aquaticum]
MAWDTWWALVLGFTLSGAVEAFVSEDRMTGALGGDGWREVGLGALLGAASSSCSYSAVGTTKTLFKKGGSGVATLGAFMFASTDLVVELGLVIWVLLGWQFVVGEYLGGVVAVAVLALLFRHVVPAEWVESAREHVRATDRTACPTCDVTVDPTDEDAVSMETATGLEHFCCGGCRRVFEARETGSDDARLRDRLATRDGWESAFRAAMKDWEMVWRDVALGFVIAGLVGGFVPDAWWTALVPGGSGLAGVTLATAVAIGIGVATFMCSVGNVPFALVLWQNGLPFGAVLSFVYADLLIPPLVRIYRQYYGARMAAALTAALAVAALVAGVTVHYVATGVGFVPPAGEVGGTVPSGYTTALNLLLTPVFAVQVAVTYGTDAVRRRTAATLDRVDSSVRRSVRLTGAVLAVGAAVVAAAIGTAVDAVAEHRSERTDDRRRWRDRAVRAVGTAASAGKRGERALAAANRAVIDRIDSAETGRSAPAADASTADQTGGTAPGSTAETADDGDSAADTDERSSDPTS